MSDTYEELKKLVMVLLRSEEIITTDIIREKIKFLAKPYESEGRAGDIDREKLFQDIYSLTSIWQADPSVLRDKKHTPWLLERKSKIDWHFWKRYRGYLEEEKGWTKELTGKLNSTTDMILGDLGNPEQAGIWDRRGMVVGDVQSGKTGNYTGLICKATDAGYKLIIVLAGMTNDLRSQTQSRLDAEFLGFESEVGKLHNQSARIGVGRLADHGKLIVHPLTDSSINGDFKANKSANIQLGGTPLLLVVKKNTSVLKRILKWVESQGKTNPETGEKVVEDIPLLFLDDEADNASVNTKSEDEDPTAINRVIRQILKVFNQSSYVGYTATPFANIFILPDEDDTSQYGPDLFPRNFIYYINPPSNYVGATQIFGIEQDLDGVTQEDNALPLIRSAEDSQTVFLPRHKKDLQVEALPESLLKAIKSFILVCAARRVRGQKSVHNSMLVHVTRFNNIQEKTQDLVRQELEQIQKILEYRTGKPAMDFIADLQELWETDFVKTSEIIFRRTEDPVLKPIPWQELEIELVDAALKIQVRGIYGTDGGVLDYTDNPNGLNVIAIGGDKLSRGLTLEGLSVSYYSRPAKNYDSLLQMGRWFGYRPGYLDLCRLYTTEELVGWYQHISVANEELKREFRIMEVSKLTPEEYGLRVRTHPNGLNITAANKIRHGKKMLATFSGHLVQTTVFHKKKSLLEQNYSHVAKWIEALGSPTSQEKSNLKWEKISPEQVKAFLSDFQTHPLSRKSDPELLCKYIDKVNANGELTDWTVALISNSSSEARHHQISGFDVGLIQRSDDTPDDDKYMLKNANIISPSDQFIDLDEGQRERAFLETVQAWERGEKRGKKKPELPSGPFIRAARPPENGLLLIYPLDPGKCRVGGNMVTELPVTGFAISFPKGVRDEVIEYQVNTQYWRERYGEDEDDE
ncbi:Z1 domain-containing protein [Nitrospina sp. 32_T5]|uniref:Z1 domain-containing protein n=1 Tax=unclassified Nitrospina TaxID=2638683 RepID=UPI003F95DAEB